MLIYFYLYHSEHLFIAPSTFVHAQCFDREVELVVRIGDHTKSSSVKSLPKVWKLTMNS
jgi:hypothetical protein